VGGKPLHHLVSAKSKAYDPNASKFFVTTTEEFEKLQGHEVQDIMRHRNILIKGVPPQGVRFDRRGLAAMGSLTANRQIQGGFYILHPHHLLTSYT
jgi:hypothetical protein